jgi:hypothetical protein
MRGALLHHAREIVREIDRGQQAIRPGRSRRAEQVLVVVHERRELRRALGVRPSYSSDRRARACRRQDRERRYRSFQSSRDCGSTHSLARDFIPKTLPLERYAHRGGGSLALDSSHD